jgi:acetoin utilization deacetylase AcuC-like enzyme
MQWFSDPGYDYGGGDAGTPREVHGFVLRKPSEIRHHLVTDGVVAASAFRRPGEATEHDLARVHTPTLIADLHRARAVARAIEFPALAEMSDDLVWQFVVRPQVLAAGGTYAALRAAAQGEWSINLSGGYHHARCGLSHGFCLINDIAVGLARLRYEGTHRRVLIIDLDLHQGDGNATIFADDRDTHTISVHEEDIFPIPKARSDLDIGLPPYTGDTDYLGAVEEALQHTRRHFTPDVIVYVAGSDPYKNDPLGSLQLTKPGLLARDQRVARFAREQRCSLVALPAGGYSSDSPSITAATFRAMAEIEGRGQKEEGNL